MICRVATDSWSLQSVRQVFSRDGGLGGLELAPGCVILLVPEAEAGLMVMNELWV